MPQVLREKTGNNVGSDTWQETPVLDDSALFVPTLTVRTDLQ
jgi:hypothetical protein